MYHHRHCDALRARTNDSFEHLTHVSQINIALNARIARALAVCPMYLFHWKTLKLISVREVCVRSKYTLASHSFSYHWNFIALRHQKFTHPYIIIRRVFPPSDELHATSGSSHSTHTQTHTHIRRLFAFALFVIQSHYQFQWAWRLNWQ